jgi:thiol:disulfide interchange protein
MTLRGRLVRYEWLLWTALVVGLVPFRWPMLKGYYYRAAGVQAPADPIAWRTDLDTALAESRRTGQPVLADFNASWCPPCIAMKHDVWPDPKVARAVMASYIPLSIDVDRQASLVDRFAVDGIPTVVVINSDGKVLRRAGFLPKSGMLRFLGDN